MEFTYMDSIKYKYSTGGYHDFQPDDLLTSIGGCQLAGSSICLIPSLLNESLSNRLLSVHRRDGEPVLFLGHPSELYLSLEVSDYAPRIHIFSPWAIKVIEKLLSYVISFSAGLAVLNVIPCMAMDGQHIVTALFEMIPVTKMISSSIVKRRILNGIIYKSF